MPQTMSELLSLLDLEALEVNLFRGESEDIGSPSVFGGQVLSQALVAAQRTVEEPRLVHSLHAYFILPGDKTQPIVYDVERIRDGGSFTTRRIVAIQHGRRIFNMSASFQKHEEGPDHQAEMPDVPSPEDLDDDVALREKIAHHVPEKRRPRFLQRRAFEVRPVEFIDPFAPRKAPPSRSIWLRARQDVALGDDPSLHRALLAYASDYALLTTALLPHGITYFTPGVRLASLDHALYFHRAFRVDEWILYTMDSPSASGARGFTRGSFYDRGGRLIGSATQEGLTRVTEPPPRT